MSHEEKRLRDKHQKNRKFWSVFLLTAIVFVSICAAFSVYLHINSGSLIYIEYEEESDIDYEVLLFDNNDYKEVSQGKAYVASDINYINAKFVYGAKVDARNVNYQYSYVIEKYIEFTTNQLETLDKHSYEVVENKTDEQNSKKDLKIEEIVQIDFQKYNAIANDFLKDKKGEASAKLIVKMSIQIKSKCEDFVEDNENSHVIMLESPLNTIFTKVTKTSSVPTAKGEMLACTKASDVMHITQYVFPSLLGADFALIIILCVFLILTKNRDVDYANKLNRIFRNYRSYIQKTSSKINISDYKLIKIHSIEEMLQLRETLSLPVIMTENEDKTCAKFFIIKDNHLLYMYSICVDGYEDLLYQDEIEYDEYYDYEDQEQKIDVAEEQQESVEEQQELVEEQQEDVEKQEELVEQQQEEVEQQEKTQLQQDEVLQEQVEDESKGNPFENLERYNYSFEAKLILSDDKVKDYYTDIVSFALSYGVKLKSSFKKERLYLGRKLFANINFSGKTLCVALALDPKEYVDTKYKFKDVSEVKKYADTPMLIKVSSGLKVKYLKELLLSMFEKEQITNKNLVVENRKISKKSKNQLIKEGLIKIK